MKGSDISTTRLRFLARFNPSKREVGGLPEATLVTFAPMECVGELGGIDSSQSLPLGEVRQGYTYFREGDVLVAKITPCFENGKGALAQLLTNRLGFASTELMCLRPSRALDGRYLFYLTVSHPFRHQGAGAMTGAAGQQRVAESFIRGYPVPTLPLATQRAIADFLDRKTRAIDELIRKKERLIELLQEKRQALITRAVTKGLDPNVPRKDSGVPWLGEVPAHWRVDRAKSLFTEAKERSTTGDEELLTVSHITGVTPRSEKTVYMFEAESLEDYKVCRPNDLAINTMWAWMGALGIVPVHGVVSPSYNVYRPRDPEGIWYYDYLVRTAAFVAEITRWSKGVWRSRLRLYPSEFFQITIPIPPAGERVQISAFLRNSLSKDQILAEKTSTSIDCLREYRQALISAAVTGQIDVTEEDSRRGAETQRRVRE